MRNIVLLLLVLVCFGSVFARADIFNRQIIPIGEREAFMGNTGTGSAADTGAVYYNPAGLALMQSDKVSLLGSVYLSFTNKVDGVAEIEGTSIPYEAKGFNTIPGTYVGSSRWGDWHLAFSAMVPDSLQFDNRVSFSTPNTTGSLIQSYHTEDLWLGASAAVSLNDQWSLGWTLFGIRHSEAFVAGSVVGLKTDSRIGGTTLARSSLSAFGLSLTTGVSYRPADFMSLGLRVQSPLVQLSGSADWYSSAYIVDPTGTDPVQVVIEDKKDQKANFRLPLDMTFGSAFHFGSILDLLWDTSLQFGTQYDSIPDAPNATRYAVDPTLRLNFGAELKIIQALPIRAGFFYNPSALHKFVANESNQTQLSYFGTTLGFSYLSKHIESGFGLFYLWASGKTNPTADASHLVGASAVGYGALITTAYVF